MSHDWTSTEELAAWLAGALPGDDACEIEDRIGRSHLLQERVSRLSRAMDALEPERPPWRLPPPGRARGAANLSAAPNLSPRMGRMGIRVEDVVDVHISGADELADRLVVLLRARVGDPWELLGQPFAYLRDFEKGESGFVVPISVGAEPGLWRWAIALPDPALLHADLDDAQWEETLREAIAQGTAPACTFQVELTS